MIRLEQLLALLEEIKTNILKDDLSQKQKTVKLSLLGKSCLNVVFL